MKALKLGVHRLLRRLGLDVVRYPSSPAPPDVRSVEARRNWWLANRGVTLLLDVGANVGQHARSVRARGYSGRIASFEPDIEPEFEDGVNAWLCPPRDPRALADAINALAGDPALRERLGAGAHRLADQCFSWTRTIDGTLAMLRGEDPRPFGAFGIHRPDPGP